MLEKGQRVLGEQLKPELHEHVVEITTTICSDIHEVREELTRLRGEIIRLAGEDGLAVAAAGTHPFSDWEMQKITPLERYIGVKKDLGILADHLLIFGTHIHIGIEDRAFLIEAMNGLRTFLPHLLCLSASSPFWMGHNTGLQSYRSVIFKHLPRTGIPPIFRSWSGYQTMVDSFRKSNCIPDGSKIWWDIRPHWKYQTLEIRICDVCTKIDEVVCIAAIIQALVYRLWQMRQDHMGFRSYHAPYIEENKWRAARSGLDGNLVNFGRLTELPGQANDPQPD